MNSPHPDPACRHIAIRAVHAALVSIHDRPPGSSVQMDGRLVDWDGLASSKLVILSAV
jgi:hypothetical protein